MDVKFQITTTYDDFTLAGDPFTITVKDRYGRVVRTMGRDDCFWDDDGRFYFTLENVRRGVYYAYFTGSYEDEDYDKQRATVTDAQVLLTVPSCVLDKDSENIKLIGRKQCCRHKVHYRVVTTVSLDGDEYLADIDGKYILTSDGKRIAFKNPTNDKITDMGKVRLNMTGDEFKQLIEGENPNGEIDTIPEMMQAAQGISDDTTIKEDVTDDLVGNLTDEDMEKWFDDDPTNDDPEEEEDSSSDSSDGSSSE